jgi:HPr kinase/phosphorylase
MQEKLSVRNCKDALDLTVIHGEDYLSNEVKRAVVSRPGVEIYSNYFDFYEYNRIQVLGTKEMNLYYMLDKSIRKERIDKLFSFLPPAFIFTHNVSEIPSEFIEASDKYKIPILRSLQTTTTCISALGTYLSEELAVKKSFHGVMMDINGVGVMLTGKSRIGKSETALQLLKMGHTLISDDRVDIAEPSVGMLVATCPKMIEKMMEVRGIGLIDVVDLFGVRAFRNKKRLSLIVELKSPEEEKSANRLGTEEEYETIFSTRVPKVTIYVKPGRNIASLVEVAAYNWRLKSIGKNAALEFTERLEKIVKGEDN